MIEIDFDIAGNNIFIPCEISYVIKCSSRPWLTAAIMPIAQLALIFHVPTILAFSRSFTGQHESTLLFFIVGIVQGCRIASDRFHGYAMQGRMIATIIESSGQVQTHLLPFGQAQSRSQLLMHLFGTGEKLALELRIDLVSGIHSSPIS
jgi:hypothetical protein